MKLSPIANGSISCYHHFGRVLYRKYLNVCIPNERAIALLGIHLTEHKARCENVLSRTICTSENQEITQRGKIRYTQSGVQNNKNEQITNSDNVDTKHMIPFIKRTKQDELMLSQWGYVWDTGLWTGGVRGAPVFLTISSVDLCVGYIGKFISWKFIKPHTWDLCSSLYLCDSSI